jgi:hypothetical protein
MCMCIGCDPEVEYTVNIRYIDSYTVSMINYQQAYKYPNLQIPEIWSLYCKKWPSLFQRCQQCQWQTHRRLETFLTQKTSYLITKNSTDGAGRWSRWRWPIGTRHFVKSTPVVEGEYLFNLSTAFLMFLCPDPCNRISHSRSDGTRLSCHSCN